MFHEPGPPVADGKSWMLHGRPSFSDARHSSPFTGSLNQVPGGRHQTEKELLHKIELLSEYHARNVKALDRLRRSAPIEVWGKDTEPPMHHKAIGLSADNTRRHSSDSASSDDECRESNTFVAPRPVSRSRRGSIRVLASSGSSSNRQVTVVEPFRSMETHTIAWKRKIREQDEVGRMNVHIMVLPPITVLACYRLLIVNVTAYGIAVCTNHSSTRLPKIGRYV